MFFECLETNIATPEYEKVQDVAFENFTNSSVKNEKEKNSSHQAESSNNGENTMSVLGLKDQSTSSSSQIKSSANEKNNKNKSVTIKNSTNDFFLLGKCMRIF